MEASGVVTKAGLMTDFRVNERVIIGHPDGTVNKIVSPKIWQFALGDLDLTSAELTTIPIAYVTSYYAWKNWLKWSQRRLFWSSATGAVSRSYLNCIILDTRIIATVSQKKKKVSQKFGCQARFELAKKV